MTGLIPGKLYQIKRSGYFIYGTLNESIENNLFTFVNKVSNHRLVQPNLKLQPRFVPGDWGNSVTVNDFIMFISQTKYKSIGINPQPKEESIYLVLYKSTIGYIQAECLEEFDWTNYDNFSKNMIITLPTNPYPNTITTIRSRVEIINPSETITLEIKV